MSASRALHLSSNDSIPMLTVYRVIGTNIISLLVGSGVEKKFSVHKKILAKKAPAFGKMFNSKFQEGLVQSAILPEDLPHIKSDKI